MRVIFVIAATLLSQVSHGQVITVSGLIKEHGTKESIPYVNVSVEGAQFGVSANAFGFYSIQVPSGQQVHLRFSATGYRTLIKEIQSDEDFDLNIELVPEIFQLDEIVIESDDGDVIDVSRSSTIPVQAIKDIPALLGEKDLIKTIQLLPGIQRATEGSTALHVRGGGPDQNLIILDDAPVYNANHLFGFFSVFNGDAIKRFDFWKSGIPARYGGRVSSVIDVKMKDGNKERLRGEGGIGLLSSRLTLDGPIKQGKSSFLLSGRRTYLDLLTTPFMPDESKFGYRFYDLNAKITLDGDAHNKFYLSGYFGNDRLRTTEKTERTTSVIKSGTDLGWGNATSAFRWNHIFNDKLFANTTLLYSNFQFFLEDSYERTGSQPNNSYSEYRSGITDYAIKTDLDYYLTNAHNIKAGASLTYHQYQPRVYTFSATANIDNAHERQRYANKELAVYIEDRWKLNEKISANVGLRVAGLLTSEHNYFFAEPRVSFSFPLPNNYRVTGSYARTNQFVHLLSNTGVGLSTDLWVPVTAKAPPQQGDQLSVGLSRDLPKHGWTFSVESYRKYMRNIIAYTQGASFLIISEGVDNLDWEENITTGKGLSYGSELLIEKNKGKLTGWLAYTLSWTIHEFPELNYGKRFYPRYDSRHAISVAAIYILSDKTKLSATWVFNTGNAITVPQAYYYGNVSASTDIRTTLVDDLFVNELVTERINRIPYYGSRNSFRAESYHRLDVSVQFHKKKKRYERYWEFGLFNAYSRKNPLYYYLETTNDPSGTGQRTSLKKKSLFPILPSISYNIRF